MKQNKEGTDRLLDNLKITITVLGKHIFPLVPDTLELSNVLRVDLVDVLGVGSFLSPNHNRTTNDDVERATVGHHADVVVEDTTSMEEWDSKAKRLLDKQLKLVDGGVSLRVELLVELIFAER